MGTKELRMKKSAHTAVLFTILLCGLLSVNIAQPISAQTSPANAPITRIQAIDGGAVNHGQQGWDNSTQTEIRVPAGTQVSAALTKQPQAGNVLVAVIGLQALVSNSPFYAANISSISQDGVTWTRQTSNSYRGWTSGVEIWLGVVGANAASSLTFNIAVDPPTAEFIAVSYVVSEYSGVSTTAPLDQTAVAHSTEATTSTGKTSTTNAANELWMGAVYVESSVTQTAGLNGFSLIGGTTKGTEGRISTALLERVATEKGQAWSGSDISAQNTLVGYIGCIATFYASDQTPHATSQPSATSTPPTSANGSVVLAFTCQSITAPTMRVHIEGSLSADGSALPNEPVIFSYSVNNGASWLDLTSVSTDNQGNFQIQWTPQATGNYLIKANWAGNAAYPSATTTVNLAIAPTQQSSNLFSVNSNSTLSTLSFDSATQQLGFSVSGPSGTTGYVEVYIPKTLLSDVSSLTVRLDDKPLQFSYQSEQDMWLVSFTYHHSSHQVTMNLGSTASEVSSVGDSLAGWIIAAAVLIPLAILVVVIGIEKKGKTKQS
jgi:hypothetical protein